MDVMNEKEIQQLVRGCLDGNRQHQEVLYATYSRRMFGVCMRYARNREEAEDFLQDAFVKVFVHLHQFKSTGSFEGWIRKIVIRTIMENLRKKSLMFKVVDVEEAEDEGGREPFPESVSLGELVTLIQDLSPGCRAVFNLYAIEGYSHAEIAALLGIRTGTSKSHYSTARKILRERIQSMNKEIILKS
jgi:RNA polymerase sigma factor (sigma-70 family)